MNRALIEQINARVAAELPQIKKYGLFNDDFDKMDQGTRSGAIYPAMFLSFPESVTYSDTGSGNQKTEEFTLRFQIGVKVKTDDNVLDAFDLKQEVFKTFHKWKPDGASSLTRILEETDESRGGIYVFIQDYSLVLTDSEKYINNERTEVSGVDLVLDADLIIDEDTKDGIRTDNKIQR